jgi:hypothetical protein
LRAWNLSDTQNLARVASYYALTNEPDLLTLRLNELLGNRGTPGATHTFLAETASHPLVIVTTNYDTLMETALQAAKKPFNKLVHYTGEDWKGSILFQKYRLDSAGDISLEHEDFVEPTVDEKTLELGTTTMLYKMHGSVERSQFVITEEHYVEFLSRINGSPPAVPDQLKNYFRSHLFLFLGYGLGDWNFRVILDGLMDCLEKTPSQPAKVNGAKIAKTLGIDLGEALAPPPAGSPAFNQPQTNPPNPAIAPAGSKPREHWAIQRNPIGYDRQMWQKRNVRICDGDLADFINKLRQLW